MGIDVYLLWDGQTNEEKKAQICGFSTWNGHVGYLREAYHGAPYMTKFLVAEAFANESDEGVHIPARVLQDRLEQACEITKQRERKLYSEDADTATLKSIADFIALATRLESDGKNPRVYVSA